MNGTPGSVSGSPAGVLLPEPALLFRRRAARLGALAETTPGLAGYLRILAQLAERQATAAARLGLMSSGETGWQRRDHVRRPLDPLWDEVLRNLIGDLKEPAAALRRLAAASAAERETWAEAVLAAAPQPAWADCSPFIAAALEVVWVASAARIDPATLAPPPYGYACPVCGSLPLASVVATRDGVPGLRYLHCGWCAAAWRYPRLQCVYCGEGGQLACFGLNGADLVKAETCDHCQTYLKVIYRDQEPGADPCADDLATLALDVLLNEQGYRRLGCNPFLIPGG